MPYYGLKSFKCKTCGKTFYRMAGDVVTIFEIYCSKCLIKNLVNKIKTIFK